VKIEPAHTTQYEVAAHRSGGVANLARFSTSAKRERTERLQVTLPTEELAAIDEFRFQARMPSRAAAIRELLKRGLASADED
jgi:hypothetical protein